MPFNPAPSTWIAGLSLYSTNELGDFPLNSLQLIAQDGGIWELVVNNDGTLGTALLAPAPDNPNPPPQGNP